MKIIIAMILLFSSCNVIEMLKNTKLEDLNKKSNEELVGENIKTLDRVNKNIDLLEAQITCSNAMQLKEEPMFKKLQLWAAIFDNTWEPRCKKKENKNKKHCDPSARKDYLIDMMTMIEAQCVVLNLEKKYQK